MSKRFDFAIVGSGVSGGRMAHELSRRGASCVVIEAGHRFESKTFPSNEAMGSVQLYWNGGLEVSKDGRLGFLRGKCVGGTSVINQALLDRFDDLAWEDWQQVSGIEWLNRKDMSSTYDLLEKELSISTIPEKHWNRNAQIFTRAFDEAGYAWKALRRSQGECALGEHADEGSDCIVCLSGCPRNSKQSSLVTTLAWAEKKGASIESEFEVHSVDHQADGVRVQGMQRGAQAEILAERLILAAGAIGNTSILFRSGLGKYLPALGKGFTCHPQFMTYALFDEQIDAHKGAFQTVKSDDGKLRRAGYKFENVFAPPISTAMLLEGYGRKHLTKMRKYRHYASMEVALRDDAVGEISLDSRGKPVIKKHLTREDLSKMDAGLEIVREMFESAGAKEIIQCRQGFGLHLMGGCAIGNDSRLSVVNPDFQVHGFPRFIVADSSVFPSAPGINPSFTIMALSMRAAQKAMGEHP